MARLQPRFSLLDDDLAKHIDSEARSIVSSIGIEFLGTRARTILSEAGLKNVDGRFLIPADYVERALSTTPTSVTLYDRAGVPAAELTEKRVHFTPGSSAMHYLDPNTETARPPTTLDFVRFTKLTDALPALYAASTAFVPSDVPHELSDAWRLYLALRHTTKPIVTGAFSSATLDLMIRFLLVIRGSAENLAKLPLAMFSVCPSSPLRFTEATSDNLIECATKGIPVELIGMPISGLVAPVTLVGTLIQHTAENLSGLVLSQLAAPGAPIVWGGSPAIFDIRSGTTPLGAIESMMIAAGYVEMGKRYGLPTQAYMGTSDSKLIDAQAGIDSGMGAMIAALAGANSISGAGMLELENCQSAEKLLIDHDVCRSLLFLTEGVPEDRANPISTLMERIVTRRNVLVDEHTRLHRPSQRCDVSTLFCRANRTRWIRQGASTIFQRARIQVNDILMSHQPQDLEPSVEEELKDLILHQGEPYGLSDIPLES